LSEDEQIEGTKNAFLTTGDVQVRKKTFYTLGTFGNKGIIAINELMLATLQKYAIDRFFSNRSQVIMALMNLKSHGITEDRILQLNNLLENSGYKDMISKSLID
jgi:hypothetical protein